LKEKAGTRKTGRAFDPREKKKKYYKGEKKRGERVKTPPTFQEEKDFSPQLWPGKE